MSSPPPPPTTTTATPSARQLYHRHQYVQQQQYETAHEQQETQPPQPTGWKMSTAQPLANEMPSTMPATPPPSPSPSPNRRIFNATHIDDFQLAANAKGDSNDKNKSDNENPPQKQHHGTSAFMKYVRMLLMFGYLELLLWSALLHPSIDVDVRWIPKSFFSSKRQSTCIVRLHRTPLAWLEVTYFTVLAMFGYFCGCAGPAGIGMAIYGKTLASFENAMMGVRQRFWWFCLLPWLITFAQNWLHNVGEFVFYFIGGGGDVLAAQNLYSTIALMLCYFVGQALLASEVACMALQGWVTMRNISNENVEWEKRKLFFSGLMEDTGFGLRKP